MKLPIMVDIILWLGIVTLSNLFVSSILAEQIAVEETQQNSIRSISVSTMQGGEVVAKLVLDKALENTPIGTTLNNPSRIYFDFYNTSNNLGTNIREVDEGELNSINIVQVGDRTRVVLNLSSLMTHEILEADNALLIKLNRVTESQVVSPTVNFVEEAPVEAMNSLRDIDFRRGVNGEGRVEVDLLNAGSGIDVYQKGDDLIVEFVQTYLPNNLERKLDVVDFATPIKFINTTRYGGNVRMVVKPTGRWEHSAYQSGTHFVLEVRELVESKEEIEKKKNAVGGYTGEKLSLNFQNVEVRAVLQVIADFTNLNIIASDSVGGKLTLRLRDVPWDQAFDIILQSNGLDKRKTGNVIFVAPSKEMADRELFDLEAKLQVSEMEPLQTEIFQLNHRRVTSISFEGMLTERGMINIDEISNTLTISDLPKKIVELREFIQRLDVFERQVIIEARIVEATENFSRDLGARFGVKNVTGVGNSRRFGASGSVEGSSGLASSGAVSSLSDNLNINLPAAGALGLAGGPAALGLSLIKINNGRLINLELSALQTDSKGRVIASPRVVTAHGVEAVIEQGDRVPFQQATSSGATSVRFVNATLSLKVKPLITHDNKIDMELDINQDKIGESVNAFLPPAINTKKVTTKVLVDNGGTVVIGGIFERVENNVVNKVPLLGDIPLIGNLFRNLARQDDKRELLVFVTPRILKEELNLQ